MKLQLLIKVNCDLRVGFTREMERDKEADTDREIER